MAVTNNTTQVVHFTAAADELVGQFYIQKIRWIAPTSASHTLVISDTTSTKVVFEATAGVANVDQECDFHLQPLMVNGITITALGSGTVDIYTL